MQRSSLALTLLTRILNLVVFLTVSLPACTSNSAPPLQVATDTWPGYEPLYLASTLGNLSDNVLLAPRSGCPADPAERRS